MLIVNIAGACIMLLVLWLCVYLFWINPPKKNTDETTTIHYLDCSSLSYVLIMQPGAGWLKDPAKIIEISAQTCENNCQPPKGVVLFTPKSCTPKEEKDAR